MSRIRVECLLNLIEMMELVSAHSFNITSVTLEPLSDEDQLLLLHERMIATGMLPKQAKVDSTRGMVRVFIANSNMEYLPAKKYCGETLLINALDAKETKLERLQNYERWKTHIPSLSYHESPGNHITLIDNLNVKALMNIVENS